jgi:AcrR family transcriptional regulator
VEPLAKAGRKPHAVEAAGAEALDAGGRPDARERLVAAAFDALRDEGFAGASARAIATRAGVNQAQIFYYFGSVNNLLVAALDQTKTGRMDAVREATAGVTNIEGLFAAVEGHLLEELASGRLKVLAEMITASSTDPALKVAVADLVVPWLEVTRDAMRRISATSAAASLIPEDQIAFALVSICLGMELLMNFTGDEAMVKELFATGRRLASVADAFFPSSAPRGVASPATTRGRSRKEAK